MTQELPPLPVRPADGHKGTFGTVCVLGGQAAGPRVMIGGPAFSASAALRAGAGLAVLAMPRPVMAAGLTIASSATGLALPVDDQRRLMPSRAAEILDEHLMSFACLAAGPGFGADVPQQQIVVRLTNQQDVPLVLDADALNALAAMREFHHDFNAHAILTPHPGEYARLALALQIQADPKHEPERKSAALDLAARLGCVVVLKGHRTIVSDGINCWACGCGGPALGTAGTGDVLTGVIAGFVAQFFKPSLGPGARQVTAADQGGLSLYDCARLAVHVHALAGDRWTKRHSGAGLLASDLLDELPAALASVPRATSPH